jgi:long-chain acyl-CoA synthetase
MPLAGAPLPDPVDIPDLLRAGLETRPDADAVVSLERRWTFRELDAASDRLAAAYRGLGLAPGDRIASLMPNRGALLVHYLACMKGHFVAVPLNYRYTPYEMGHALARSTASALLHHVERAPDVAACAEARALPCGTIGYGAEGRAPGHHFEALIEAGGPATAVPSRRPEASAFILFTSGSTGPAKGVTHSFASLRHVFGSATAGLELTADDIMLPGSSMSHLGGLLFSFAALAAGARVVVARSFDPDEILPLLRGERPTVMCMLPAALFRLVRDGHASHRDFASLRLVRSGSDKVPAELETEFTKLTGLAIDEGYGCTEAGLATLNPPSGRIVPGSIGRPLPGFELSIRDASGREVASGGDGIAWIRGRSLMAGYWDDDDATASVLRDGWLDSGDMMQADADGYLWFRGRKKQIIVHDGSNIFPQEVEDALLLHPDVASAGVIGVHDLLHGENVRAYVVVRPGSAPTEAALIAFARERIGYKAPEEIEFLDEMPLNPTGKTDRVALKRLAEERHKPIRADG